MRGLAKRSVVAAWTIGLSVAATAASAHADDAPSKPVSQHEMSKDIDSYYDGEATSAYVILNLGLVEAGAGAVLVNEHFDFAQGLGWPLLTMGALETIGGIFYAFTVDDESSRYQALLSRDPRTFKREELAHIQGTRRHFIYYRLTELGITIAGAGIATYGFAANRDVWKGLGLGIASVGLPFLIIDTVNNGRAANYADALDHFDPAIARAESGPALLAPQTPWMFSYSGSF
jgi:hypothetical protein